MKYFFEMLQVAKKQGHIVYVEKDNQVRYEPLDKVFSTLVEKCKVFVFSPKNEEPVEAPEFYDEAGLPIMKDLDAPFPVFSIEVLDGLVTSPRRGDQIDVITYCIMAAEFLPKKFVYYALVGKPGHSGKMVTGIRSFDGICEEFINRINNESHGQEKVDKLTVLVGKNNKKYDYRIRNIIHIRPKKDRIQSNPISSNPIDWTHRWSVRGHWRTNEGSLGKDREGNYCVEGFTWVNAHTKGPDGKPLIENKVRFVK